MRESRLSGSEGGVALITPLLPLSWPGGELDAALCGLLSDFGLGPERTDFRAALR
jgi:hypothetical protein